jgi:hypothetical protein
MNPKFKMRADIIYQIRSGTKKIEIYNSFSDQFGNQPLIVRILNDFPSMAVKKKYDLLIKFILALLTIVAFIKGYFLIFSFLEHSKIPNFLMFTTLMAQLLMIWMVFNTSRTGLIGTIVLTGYYFFDYQKGLHHANNSVKILCLIILISSILTILSSIYLYLKIKEDWRST